MIVNNTLPQDTLLAGVVVAKEVKVKATPEKLQQELKALVVKRQAEEFPPEDLKKAVRDLLRSGGFKPSGRNKPASEYLAQAARKDDFPIINNLVDINNYISLYSGLPASLLDLNATSEEITLRYGRPEESYTFNQSGQEIDLKGLVCVCNANTDSPLGNPVKDSMIAKLKETTSEVIGVVYSPKQHTAKDCVEELMELYSKLLEEFGEAKHVEVFVS